MYNNTIPVINDTKVTFNNRSIPTSDAEVRSLLRKLKEPITYFGEDNADRRSRLIKFINEMPHTNFGENFVVDDVTMKSDQEDEDVSEDDEEFYTPGTHELLDARKQILTYSLRQASARIRRLREEHEPDPIKVLKHRRIINGKAAKFEIYGSQLIPNNQRAISTVRYNDDNSKIACGSWDGNIYILDSQLSLVGRSVPGYHLEKVSGLDWNGSKLLTGGNEGSINYWDCSSDPTKPYTPLKTIKAHDSRIAKSLFHPQKSHFISTSFDQTWKLWDFEFGTEILQQEGHSKEVFAASFHPDGSILSTGGLDALVKLWDLRSGRLINNLSGHIQGVYSMDWSSNGYHIATGGGDSAIKIWDLRKINNNLNKSPIELCSIPAHTKLISDLRFYNPSSSSSMKLSEIVTDKNDENPTKLSSSGKLLLSSSYDGKIRLWSADNWIKVGETISTDKVMGCDISQDGAQIVTCHWDKSVKLWQ
ncbi:hypothetical protein PSN45_003388 [Yamadazyma tenuis]|nr:hypothetical protein PSN45_003388 [Yamadazyma tenuis]